MSTLEETRRANLVILRNEEGSNKALADKIGISEAQLSQWIKASPDSKTGRPRGMKAESARRIERAAGREEGWLDVPHDRAQPQDFRDAALLIAKQVPDPIQRDRLLTFIRFVDRYLEEGQRIAASIPDIP